MRFCGSALGKVILAILNVGAVFVHSVNKPDSSNQHMCKIAAQVAFESHVYYGAALTTRLASCQLHNVPPRVSELRHNQRDGDRKHSPL